MDSLSLLYFKLKGSLWLAFLRQVPPFKHAGLQVAEKNRNNNVNIEGFIQIDKIRTDYFPRVSFLLKFIEIEELDWLMSLIKYVNPKRTGLLIITKKIFI